MKLKTLFMTAMMAVFALTASAQSAGDVRFGVTAGMNVANITDTESDCRIGFNVGVKGEYNFSNNLYGTAGLLFTQKGCKADEAIYPGKSVTIKCTPGYLQLPVNIGYRYNVGDGVSIFGETGPYFAVGVCGKYKAGDEKIDFFGDDGVDAKRFDCGWDVKVGVEASGFQIGLGYEYGFTKVWEDTSAHNSNFMVSVAYMF